MPRHLATALACALLLPASAWASEASAGNRSVNPSAAARACAGRLGPARTRSNPDATRIASLTTCVLRTERAQLGLQYRRDGGASQLVATALRRFVGLSYLAQNNPQAASNAEDVVAADARQAVCSVTPGESRDDWTFAGSKPSGAVTPLEVANLGAKLFEAPDAVARATNAVFAVATHRGRVFEHDSTHGTSLGIVAVSCP